MSFLSGQAAAAIASDSLAVDRDRLVQPGQLEDLAVVVGEPEGEQPLLLAVGPHEQRDEQADPARIHVVETGEVEDDPAGLLAACPAVGVHQRRFAGGRHLARDVDHARAVARRPHRHLTPWPPSSVLASAVAASLVVVDGHEVGQAGDLEDLPVVVGEPARRDRRVGPRAPGPAGRRSARCRSS